LADTVAGDVCCYNSTKGVKMFFRLDGMSASDVIPSDCTPIGVVVIPASHDVYGTGECAVMSLVHMSVDTPDTGALSATMYWGDIYSGNSDLPRRTSSVTIGKTSAQEDSATGLVSYGFLPFDAESLYQCKSDPIAYYTQDTDAVPSPYLADGSRNPNYYTTTSPSSTNNSQSDFNGLEYTKIVIDKHVNDRAWNSDGTIVDYYGTGYYPAFQAAWSFRPIGTSQGDWYLPTQAELGYVVVRKNTIQAVLNELGGLTFDQIYHTSTQFAQQQFNAVSMANGITRYRNKDTQYTAVAFLRVKE
jgi:hypothetical protein